MKKNREFTTGRNNKGSQTTALKSLAVIYTAEVCELFGRFAITSLLVIYLTHFFKLADSQAFGLFGGFYALLFVMPCLGGYLADKYLGYRLAAVIGAGIMFLGNICIAMPHLQLVVVGLSIVPLGYGLFVPSCTTILGSIYDKKNAGMQQRDRGFTLYYLAKNIGALCAPAMCGYLSLTYNMTAAFSLNAAVLGLGFVALVIGFKYLPTQQQCGYQNVSSSQLKPSRTLFHKITAYSSMFAIMPLIVVCTYVVLHYHIQNMIMLCVALYACYILYKIYNNSAVAQRRSLSRILIYTLFAFIFSAFLLQGAMSLNLFIERLIDRSVYGHIIPTSSLYALDPLFMMIIGPLLAGFFIALHRRKRTISAYSKCVVGLLLLAAGFGVFVLAAAAVTKYGQASILYVVIAYALFPLAELCICPITLSRVSSLAPQKHRTQLIGMYYMISSGMSSLLADSIAKHASISMQIHNLSDRIAAAHIYLNLFERCMLLLLIISVAFGLAAVIYKSLYRGIDQSAVVSSNKI